VVSFVEAKQRATNGAQTYRRSLPLRCPRHDQQTYSHGLMDSYECPPVATSHLLTALANSLRKGKCKVVPVLN